MISSKYNQYNLINPPLFTIQLYLPIRIIADSIQSMMHQSAYIFPVLDRALANPIKAFRPLDRTS